MDIQTLFTLTCVLREILNELDKKLFKDKKEAEKYYEQQELGKHITVELSIYIDGNERTLKNKGEK